MTRQAESLIIRGLQFGKEDEAKNILEKIGLGDLFNTRYLLRTSIFPSSELRTIGVITENEHYHVELLPDYKDSDVEKVLKKNITEFMYTDTFFEYKHILFEEYNKLLDIETETTKPSLLLHEYGRILRPKKTKVPTPLFPQLYKDTIHFI